MSKNDSLVFETKWSLDSLWWIPGRDLNSQPVFGISEFFYTRFCFTILAFITGESSVINYKGIMPPLQLLRQEKLIEEQIQSPKCPDTVSSRWSVLNSVEKRRKKIKLFAGCQVGHQHRVDSWLQAEGAPPQHARHVHQGAHTGSFQPQKHMQQIW